MSNLNNWNNSYREEPFKWVADFYPWEIWGNYYAVESDTLSACLATLWDVESPNFLDFLKQLPKDETDLQKPKLEPKSNSKFSLRPNLDPKLNSKLNPRLRTKPKFNTKPKTKPRIDTTQLEVKSGAKSIIYWEKLLVEKKLEIHWDFAFILRYKWEVAYILGFSKNKNDVTMKQLQWTIRPWTFVMSHVKVVDYFIELIEKSFHKKWVKVNTDIRNFDNSLINNSELVTDINFLIEKWIGKLNENYFSNKSLDN